MMNTPSDYSLFASFPVYIFDMDGTLYSQQKMHLHMASALAFHFLSHPLQITDLYLIYRFRRLREKAQYKQMSVEDLCRALASSLHLDAEKAIEVISYWMFQVPLDYIAQCAYPSILKFLRHRVEEGAVLAIYSDYPAAEKLNALGLKASYIFTANDSDIMELKPSRHAMEYIQSILGVSGDKILYVGDRNEKDGISAQLIHASYCPVEKFLSILSSASPKEGSSL